MEPLPPVPTVRISHPSTRSAEEEEEVKQHIIASLVAAGQWSGSRPAVLTSAQHFITRMRLLTKLHADSDTSSGPDVYWDDCIKNGGMAQAWASKKAGRSACVVTSFESKPMLIALADTAQPTTSCSGIKTMLLSSIY